MNALEIGKQFYYEIEDKKNEATGPEWYWEHYVPGPIDSNTVRSICMMAGCWVFDENAPQVKFYANQNCTGH